MCANRPAMFECMYTRRLRRLYMIKIQHLWYCFSRCVTETLLFFLVHSIRQHGMDLIGEKRLKLPVVCLLIMHIILRIIPASHRIPKCFRFYLCVLVTEVAQYAAPVANYDPSVAKYDS
jgi:hypothetical protein